MDKTRIPLHPLAEQQPEAPPSPREEQSTPPSNDQETGRGTSIEELEARIIEVLRSCYDPEIPVNIHELGLIYEVDIDEGRNVNIKMTLTSPMCPVAGSLPPEVQEKVGRVPGVASAKVEVVWSPPWNQDMMSESAKLQLGLY